ncbi:hypothetical protein M406DRAFT_236222, partial [Cryphonectria parasitica EP155]
MSIKPLPGDVVAQIRSSVVIASLNGVVTGLIKNSLDAEATRINVTIDYTRGNCSVEDNGTGIPPSEFQETGGLGQIHYTSKFPPCSNIHGRHGVFLASVASLSLLSITSHHGDFHSHNSMAIHNSKILTRHMPCLPEQRLVTFPHGTRVVVRDLFGSMPVRVKHRAMLAEKSTFFSRDWERLLLDVIGLLIAWPGAVSLSVREASGRQRLNLSTGSNPDQWASDSCRLLHQASLWDSPDAGDWVAIGASAPKLDITCYVCLQPVATKRMQFISLGIEPLSNESRCNILYEEVNRVFADSSFGAVEDSDSEEGSKKKGRENFTTRDLKVQKGVDKWPMFILRMSPSASERSEALAVDDFLDDRRPDLALVTDLLRAMFYEFLKKNHCRPRKVILSTRSTSRRQRTGSASPRPSSTATGSSREQEAARCPTVTAPLKPARKVPRLEAADRGSESPFGAWSKVKSGQPLSTYKQAAPSLSRTQSASTTPSQPSRNTTPCHNSTDRSKPSSPEPLSPDETFEWVNPVTKLVTTINSRTGFEMAPRLLTQNEGPYRDHASRTGLDITMEAPGSRETAPWVRDLVSRWKNPVFESAEAPIPKLPDVAETLQLDLKPGGHHCHQAQASFHVGTPHETAAMGLLGRLSKDTLRKAQLIAQVDKKFILAKVSLTHIQRDKTSSLDPPDISSVLVLIDQHAADERCRVEALMQNYFTPAIGDDNEEYWRAVTEALPKPVQFELPRHDKDLLNRFQDHFAYWGIHYDIESPIPSSRTSTGQKKMKTTTSKFKINVRSLPPAILERCRTEPRLLAELIRKEAWKLNDEDGSVPQLRPRPVSGKDHDGEAPVWVSLFHGCPQGLVELINSRSCRSAIMFNDPLTSDQCSELLDSLVRCAFPFQCAHGRPSMVPLVDLGVSGGLASLG